MKKKFVYNETVRIYDTDAQGIVHYAGYYRFFTDALEQFIWDKLDGKYPLVNERTWFVVVESSAKYHASARLGDKLSISLVPSQLSDKAVRFDFVIHRKTELICDGYITQVAIDREKWKATAIPKSVIESLFQKKS